MIDDDDIEQPELPEKTAPGMRSKKRRQDAEEAPPVTADLHGGAECTGAQGCYLRCTRYRE